MKIVRFILFSLLAFALIIATGIFLLFQTFDADQYLPNITQKASSFFGRPVSLGHVGLGLSVHGITLDLGPVIIADDPEFTSQPFIKIDKLRIIPDLPFLILHRHIHVQTVLLESPQIHFIISEQGRFNVYHLGQEKISLLGSNPAEGHSNFDGQGEASQQASSLVSNISKNDKDKSWPSFTLRVEDASVSLIDQKQPMLLDLWLRHINLKLKNFSLSNPFPLSFDGYFYAMTPNVHFNSLVALDMPHHAVQFIDLKLLFDFSNPDLNGLQGISPEAKVNSIIQNISGTVGLNLSSLGTDSSRNLTANGQFNVKGGTIKNFNPLREFFSHTLGSFLGFGGGAIDNLFSGALKSQLASPDTVIDKAQATFSWKDSTFSIDDSMLQTGICEFSAKGVIGQGLDVDLQTALHLNLDTSNALLNQFKGLKYLTDDSGRLTIQASLKGVFPDLKYKPSKDFRKKSRKALFKEGGNILGALLGGKIF